MIPTKLTLTVLLAALVANAQKPELSQRADRSTCSNILALAGDVNLSCSSLTPEQDRVLRSIPSVLNKILRNQLDPELINEKLDEILAQPRANYSCTGSICGNTINNPVLINNRPPAAKLSFHQQQLPAPNDDPNVRLVKVSVTTDRPIPGAIIWLAVDSPVELTDELTVRYRPTITGGDIQQIGWSAWNMPAGKPGPHLITVKIETPNPFRPGQVLNVTIPTNKELHVLRVFEQPTEEGQGVLLDGR